MTFRALNVRFNLCRFRSRSRLIQDVTWPVVQSCLRHELLVTVIFRVRFARQTTWSNREIIEETLRFQMTFRWSSQMKAFPHQGLVIQKLGVNCRRSNFPWLASSRFRFSVLGGRRPKFYPWGVWGLLRLSSFWSSWSGFKWRPQVQWVTLPYTANGATGVK